MVEHEQHNDPMAGVDLALTFTAPVISVRNSFLSAGMSVEVTDHIVVDFAHFLLTSMTAQALSGTTGGQEDNIDGAGGWSSD